MRIAAVYIPPGEQKQGSLILENLYKIIKSFLNKAPEIEEIATKIMKETWKKNSVNITYTDVRNLH